jgi:ParB family transcriptional regulator, chromosome partitioning protein
MSSGNSPIYNDAIFWIDVDKIKPNPYQPRREFDQAALQSLADSIRQYGVLQALVVTRKEVEKPDGGLATEYELIAGERRLRASKLAGLTQVPAQVRSGEETDLMKLELAIIENIQREDLNPVDRAKAFAKLANEFGFKHADIGKKVGKSREYVSNTLRILMLPDTILQALSEGKITEGHTRPLMMLTDRPQEQETLFKEILYKKINVRDAENIARRIAFERARKQMDPEFVDLEDRFKETLGTRVHIEKREQGGKITIDFFSKDDLLVLLDKLSKEVQPIPVGEPKVDEIPPPTEEEKVEMAEGSKEAMEAPEEDLYSVKNFSI